jgi:uncharacterized membrane protein YhaH (DUF805 family)
MFRNIFSFNGRIRRLEYALSYLVFLVYVFFVGMMIGILIGLKIIPDLDESHMELIYCTGCLPAFYFFIAQSVKRCHDRGNSGWWMFVPFYSFILLFGEGDKYQNEYGENPKLPRQFSDPFSANSGTYQMEHIINVDPIDDVDEDGIIREKI